MSIPEAAPAQGDIMASVIGKGDLSQLSGDERVRYYNEVCRSMGLNPLTQPLEFLTLNGKLTLYARRNCTDQLRKINSVSLAIVSREIAADILTVHVRAMLPDGRTDEDLGAVSFPSALKGEARANAELKAVTKAKRRATLSICGLGWLDETEIEDIPASAKRPAPRPQENVMLPSASAASLADADQPAPPLVNPETKPHEGGAGEVTETDIHQWDNVLATAAKGGLRSLREAWEQVPRNYQPTLKAALERRHKPDAMATGIP